jgi:hypothetical protein
VRTFSATLQIVTGGYEKILVNNVAVIILAKRLEKDLVHKVAGTVKIQEKSLEMTRMKILEVNI